MWDRVERLIGGENLARLRQKRVGVYGLGSGGGFVALSLAMSGVGHFVLLDEDVIEANNVVRHVADARYIGQAKAEVVADLIKHRNPMAEVETFVGKAEEHLDALDGLDLLIVGVDGENPKYTLNQACLKLGLTAIYAGVYERGEGGDVVCIRPHQGPCYACWAAKLRDDLPQNEAVQELDYGMIGKGGTLEAEPGLWLDVTRVAAVQADFALHELLKGTTYSKPMPTNTVILANTALEILTGQVTPPYSAVWVDIIRDPDCLVCGEGLQHQLASEHAPLSLQSLMSETGLHLEEREDE